MNIIDAIFDALSGIGAGFGSLLGSIFNGVGEIFFTPASTADGTATLTFVGVLLLIGVASSLVFWAFNFIKSLITNTGKRK